VDDGDKEILRDIHRIVKALASHVLLLDAEVKKLKSRRKRAA
jgi:hypothetical protein